MKLVELLGEGWESGPDEYVRPERDPDYDREERRQQQADDEADKHLITKHVVRLSIADDTRARDEVLAGPFTNSADAVKARYELNSKHPKPTGENSHRDYSYIYSYRTKP